MGDVWNEDHRPGGFAAIRASDIPSHQIYRPLLIFAKMRRPRTVPEAMVMGHIVATKAGPLFSSNTIIEVLA